MSLLELFILSVGLSMDAFAVAICKGLGMRRATLKNACLVGLYFGLFQAGMPLIGYLLGRQFAGYITDYDHWIAFGLLVFLGLRMIKEAFDKKEEEACECGQADLRCRVMLVLAVATSIDALAVGVSLAFLQVDILPAVCLIGLITFLLSIAGVKIGNVFGVKYKSKAEVAGGMILIAIGLKILLEHLEVF